MPLTQIVILSRELKYSLAPDKVKTLEKALELLPKLPATDQQKVRTIEALGIKYNRVKQKVAE